MNTKAIEISPNSFCAGVQRAMMMINEVINNEDLKPFYMLGYLVHNRNVVSYYEDYITVIKDNFEENLGFIFAILRDCVMLNANLGEKAVINSDLCKELTALSKRVTNTKIDRVIKEFSMANENIKKNASFALTVTNTLLSVWEEIHD